MAGALETFETSYKKRKNDIKKKKQEKKKRATHATGTTRDRERGGVSMIRYLE